LSDTSANSAGLGGGGGFFEAGTSKSDTLVRYLVDMIDVNGDNLPDWVMRQPGDACGQAGSAGCLRVKLNLGFGFDTEKQILLPAWPADAITGLPGGLAGVGLASPDALSYSFGQGSSGGAAGEGNIGPVVLGGGASWGGSDNSTMQAFEDID